jgi:hypothetical protein
MRALLNATLAVLITCGCSGKKGGDDATDTPEEQDTAVDTAEDDGADGPCLRDRDCDDDDPCTDDTCDEDSGTCLNEPVDDDDDGYLAASVLGVACAGGDDCDDSRDDVYPGAPEVCDDIDQNCDGSILDASDADDDGDGHLDALCEGGDDCDDTRDDVYEGAPEVCNDGVDQDCDDLIDEPAAVVADVRITDAVGQSEDPSLVWTGSEIYFTRVSAAGAEVGDDVRLTNATGASDLPDLHWTGTGYALSWSDERETTRGIYFALLDASGAMVGTESRVVSTGSPGRRSVLAWTGSEFGLAWSDERAGNPEVYFALLSDAGVKTLSDVRITNDIGSSWVSGIVWSGSTFGLAWHDDRDTDYDMYFTFAGRDGSKPIPDIRLTYAEGNAWVASMVWTTSVYALAWSDQRGGPYDVWFTRVNDVGGEVGSDDQITDYPSNATEVSLVWTGSAFGVAWADDRDESTEIYFAGVGAEGDKLTGDARITAADEDSADPSLVWTGSQFGVAWSDRRDGNYEIYLTLIDNCD